MPTEPIGTSTAAGKAFLDTLGVFAEFETNLRRERHLEGIAEAKEAGVYLKSKGATPAHIHQELTKAERAMKSWLDGSRRRTMLVDVSMAYRSR